MVRIVRVGMGIAFAVSTAIVAAVSVGASPLLSRPRPIYDKAWQHRAPPRSVPNGLASDARAYEEATAAPPVELRIHRAADGYVLFRVPLSEADEAALSKRGFKKALSAAEVRDRAIFEHEAYVGYMVGSGGPTDDELKRLEGSVVRARFRAYRGVGTPVLAEVGRP